MIELGFCSYFNCLIIVCIFIGNGCADDLIGCGGFVKSKDPNVGLSYSVIDVQLFTKQGTLKYTADCAPNNGYFMIPLYDKGEYYLKVDPPLGWNFEPERVDINVDGTDACSLGKDINFEFTGFGVAGQVKTDYSEKGGPEGVTLNLLNDGKPLQVTQSKVNGYYQFDSVLPGKYIVEGTHPVWKFSKSKVDVVVGKENNKNSESIAIAGYDLHGRIVSKFGAVSGISVILLTSASSNVEVSSCRKATPQGYSIFNGQKVLCVVDTDKNGVFFFNVVPSGSHIIMPFYETSAWSVNFRPNTLDVAIHQGSHTEEVVVNVDSVSLEGQVKTNVKGQPVMGARIIVDGESKTMSDKNGKFKLKDLKLGLHAITAKVELMEFDAVKFEVMATGMLLNPIIVGRFSVCGQILQEKAVAHNIEVLSFDQSKKQIKSDANGKFCSFLPSGKHSMKVLLLEREKLEGVKLSPEVHEVVVTDFPLTNITFSQLRVKLSGTIKCLEDCQQMQVALEMLSTYTHSEKEYVQAARNGQQASFAFENIIPGNYNVSLLHEDWCWEEKSLTVELIDSDDSSSVFEHVGYILSCNLSHDVLVEVTHMQNNAKPVGSFQLGQGLNVFCLAKKGTYQIVPKSCHRFEWEVYSYKTEEPHLLQMTAVAHKTSGVISMPEARSDIVVSIASSAKKDALVISNLKTESKSPPFLYKFSYWDEVGAKLLVTVSSAEFMFYPARHSLIVSDHECRDISQIKFEGKRGLFVSGQVKPAIKDVVITIQAGDEAITVKTTASGLYRAGPFHQDTEYRVAAFKEGFSLQVAENTKHDFVALKLGKLVLSVFDEKNVPLSGALVSLSGGIDYRSNQISSSNGTLTFASLSPGQYFLRILMKEYEFTPSSQMVEVMNGGQETMRISGRRVAFSCYGTVTSLDGEAESDVVVEAVSRQGSARCADIEEETKSDEHGGFRIRGLMPNCQYLVRIKDCPQNAAVERSAPVDKEVLLQTDLVGIDFIVFRRWNQTDLSADIVIEGEQPANLMQTLKIKLYKENNPDSTFFSATPTSMFVFLPVVPHNDQHYLLLVQSTSAFSTWNIDYPQISFTANSSYKHFNLVIKSEKKVLESDLGRSSLLMLPFIGLLIVALYHREMILPHLKQLLEQIQCATMAAVERSQEHRKMDTKANIHEDVDSLMQSLNAPKKRKNARKT